MRLFIMMQSSKPFVNRTALILICPDVLTAWEQPACWFLRSPLRGTPHLELHKPVIIGQVSIASHQPDSPPSSRHEPESLNSRPTHLVEIKNQVQLTNIAKETIQHLDEEVYSLQIRKLIIIRVHARAKEQPRVSPIHDLIVAELDEVWLVFLIAGCYKPVDLLPISDSFSQLCWCNGKAVYLALELDLLFVIVWRIPFCEPGFASVCY